MSQREPAEVKLPQKQMAYLDDPAAILKLADATGRLPRLWLLECVNCGRRFAAQWRRKTCSDACRMAWWRAQQKGGVEGGEDG